MNAEASLDTIASPVNSKALKVNIPKIVTDFVSPRKSALRTPNQMSPLSSTQSARRVSFVGVVDKPPGMTLSLMHEDKLQSD